MRQYVYLDECGVTTDLLRLYGRSPRGTRLSDHTPCSHWQTHTVIAALRLEGLGAPAVFDGPIDSPSFLAYIEQVLVPTLRPGDVVVLDNLAVHKQPAVRTAIDYRGFGKSSKALPSETMAYEDARAAWDWLGQKYPNRPRYIFGHSLGAAIAIELAAQVSEWPKI